MDDTARMKAEIKTALDVLIPYMEPSPEDACACMGPMEGHTLCHCAERSLARQYLKEWLAIVSFTMPKPNNPF